MPAHNFNPAKNRHSVRPEAGRGQFAYGYNAANQRTRMDLGDGTYWDYGYDDLGQLTSGARHWSADGTPVGGQQYGYHFDGIGNRQTATVNGRESAYTLKSPAGLNQYDSRTVPGAADLIGAAAADATVTVNDQRAARKGEYWSATVTADNSSAPVRKAVTMLAVKNNAGPHGEDKVASQTGNILLPKTPEQFQYDLDGNLTQDGLWSYTWDAENRLVGMESIPSVPAAAKQKLQFAYDWMNRRISKQVFSWNAANGTYQTVATTQSRFVYDGWNLIAELDAGNAVTRSYLWGLDLSATPQGAGGVGGLIAMTTGLGTNAASYFYRFDGNGNVTGLVDATGAVVAMYEYGPFGEPLRVSGVLAGSNPFQFSTKYTDTETGLVYYGYRYYKSSVGKWISRDPIDEDGGLNLYVFCANSAANRVDVLGHNYLDCLGSCIEQNDPMNAIIDGIAARIVAHLAIGSAGVPKSLLLWIAKCKGDEKLVAEIRLSMRMGADLGYKPLKIILEWLTINKAVAAKAARGQVYILAIYGSVLAIVELDCAQHCLCKDRYDGNNLFNTKEAIDFYMNQLFQDNDFDFTP